MRRVDHDALALDEVGDGLQVKAGGALATLDMLDTPAPTGAGRGPLAPEADDESAGRGNGGWLSHDDPLSRSQIERAAPGPGAPFRTQGHAQKEATASSRAWRIGV